MGCPDADGSDCIERIKTLRLGFNSPMENSEYAGRLTRLPAPIRLRTGVTLVSPGTSASSTTKRGLRRIPQIAAGKGDLTDAKKTDAKKLQAEKLTETEAIERAKLGDGEAFQFLYGLHKRRGFSLCLWRTGN